MDKEKCTKQWDQYLTAYGPTSSEERDLLLNGSVSDDLVFMNPGGEGRTRAGLIAHIEDFQKKMSGSNFTTEKLLFHHDQFMAIWSMQNKDNHKVATGYNFVRLDENGLFCFMAGFF